MSFNRKEVSELLAKCHRRCCICHRFCGFKMETHHIVSPGDGGSDDIGNAIPVCFECHAEISSYNNEHPRGRKFTPDELKCHKNQWIEICEKRPEIFAEKLSYSEVGPLQALIGELEFNVEVASRKSSDDLGSLFMTNQFQRSIEFGILWLLNNDTKNSLITTYATMFKANNLLSGVAAMQDTNARNEETNKIQQDVMGVGSKIEESLKLVKAMLPEATE